MHSKQLQAVVFDWAGTLVDFGSLAPMGAFVRLFAQEGVGISVDDARAPMGLPKWHHIQALGRMPHVAQAWRAAHGRDMSDADVDRLHDIFTPMNAASVRDHAQLVPGALEVVRGLRAQGLKVGTTTGYNRPIASVLAELAQQQGFVPDNLVCAGDLPDSRPSPLGMYQCFIALNTWPAYTVVKVDDTVPGLLEGANAGCWTVAVAVSGNAVGLSLAQWQQLSPQQQAERREQACASLAVAQPDFVIDSVAELPPVLEDINRLLASGQRPRGAPAQPA